MNGLERVDLHTSTTLFAYFRFICTYKFSFRWLTLSDEKFYLPALMIYTSKAGCQKFGKLLPDVLIEDFLSKYT